MRTGYWGRGELISARRGWYSRRDSISVELVDKLCATYLHDWQYRSGNLKHSIHSPCVSTGRWSLALPSTRECAQTKRAEEVVVEMSLPAQAGRPRDEALTERVLSEVATHILSDGLPALRIEAIAQRAKTTKPAIYRRWPKRSDLILDAIERIYAVGELPDTGNLHGDLAAYVNYQPIVGGADGATLQNFAYTVLSPEVLPGFIARFGKARRELGAQILMHWVGQGALPKNLDADLVLDSLLGVLVFRNLLLGKPVTPAEYDQLVGSLISNPPVKAGA